MIAAPAMAQDTQVTVESNGTKIINGFFTQQQLATDSAFLWYGQNKERYSILYQDFIGDKNFP